MLKKEIKIACQLRALLVSDKIWSDAVLLSLVSCHLESVIESTSGLVPICAQVMCRSSSWTMTEEDSSRDGQA